MLSSKNVEDFLFCVEKEFIGATNKFPNNENQTVALMEEVGELANALLEHGYGKGDQQSVYNEAVQVAAMAMRIAVQGDRNFRYAFSMEYPYKFKPTGTDVRD